MPRRPLYVSLIRFCTSASTAATYIALVITSLAVGYWIGVGSTLPITRGGSQDEPDNDSGEESDATDDADDDGLEKVAAGEFDQCKMVRVDDQRVLQTDARPGSHRSHGPGHDQRQDSSPVRDLRCCAFEDRLIAAARRCG